MQKLTTQEVRNIFIEFFKKKDHEHVPSSSLIPHNDPSLMFVNSGMVQFKDIFTGIETRPYSKATSYQKAIRAGGKHNDLDNVGYTARHHTFFEMLGNFSFGDYFKEQAIYDAWHFLTQELKLPPEKLYVTVYHDDHETALFWQQIAQLSPERIIKIKTNDNFWFMGDSGPCGPCTEIFYDHGPDIPGGLPGTPTQDGDRFIEIWNLVFMQFEQLKDKRIMLPKKSVDTGMGLERISAVMQGVHDNYEIDVFKELIQAAESLIGVKATGSALFSYRVIADHVRASAFLIADGVMPANDGRGYVLRRIMRRAMRHAHQLGTKEPVMYRLLPQLITLFGHPYNEIIRAQELITSIMQQEEERFKSTLDRGLKLLNDETATIAQGGILPGNTVFKLYDTYGFPIDLTEDILKQSNISIDRVGFNQLMYEQKERARKAWSGSGELKTDTVWFDLAHEFGATEFLGYSLSSAEGEVLAILQSTQPQNTHRITKFDQIGSQFLLITNQTPFYGESGGQMGDTGIITSTNCHIKVTNTLKFFNKIIAHVCELTEGIISIGDKIKLSIDHSRRQYLQKHHTATHILHTVLRNVLGHHIAQKGSLVAEDKIRFDISHPKAITAEEIKIIEAKVNDIIIENSEVKTTIMATAQAIQAGAMALFGEKYDDEVRVVSLGVEHTPYSIELCGGTHVTRTGDIGTFKIISESAIAAGIRRIEAVCGKFALQAIAHNEGLLAQVIAATKSNPHDIVNRVNNLLVSTKLLELELEKVQLNSLLPSNEEINQHSITIGQDRLYYAHVAKSSNTKLIRMTGEYLAKQYKDLVIVLSYELNHKLSVVIAVTPALCSEYSAATISQLVADHIGGSGGGKAAFAQVGGGTLDKLPTLKDYVLAIIKQQ